MAPAQRRGPWVPEEDQELLQLVRTQGPNNWVRISQHMKFRSPKQCRERFHQNLKPSLNHDPITPEEGLLIERMVNEMGKRWAEIARRLGNRSDNAVKNWWNGNMSRKKRRLASPREPAPAHHHHHHHHHHSSSRVYNGRIEPPYPKSPVHSQFLASQRRGTQQQQQPSWLSSECSRSNPASIYDWTHEKSQQRSPNTHHRQLPPLFTLESTSHIEHPLTSPCFSEMSNRTSAGPPSMISDHTSVASASPRTMTSPSIPPILMEINPGYQHHDGRRRGSAPTVGMSSSTTSCQSPAYGSCFTATAASSAAARSMEALPSSGSRDWPSDSYRARLSSLSDTTPRPRNRDARMGLNNLLN